MKGYKAFNRNWTCLGKQYEVGKIFEEDIDPEVCRRGMHFCKSLIECFKYYKYDETFTRIAEVEAIGKVVSANEGTKSCTNKLHIIREIPWEEIKLICNPGFENTGCGNTGNYNDGSNNTGDHNKGNINTGDCNNGSGNVGYNNYGSRNTGDFNYGDWNAGNYNIGSFNTNNGNIGASNSGLMNRGCHNTGNFNTGNRNTGDWNCSSYNTGCFMTEEQCIYMFNKPTNWKYEDWEKCDAREYLREFSSYMITWVEESSMTPTEMIENPSYIITKGYLKYLYKENTETVERAQRWWDNAPEYAREAILKLPNFDAEIFRQCTGIDVNHNKDR